MLNNILPSILGPTLHIAIIIVTIILYHGIDDAEGKETSGVITVYDQCSHKGIQELRTNDRYPMMSAGRCSLRGRKWRGSSGMRGEEVE